MTGDYASAVVRRFFDVRRPVAQYASIPRSYVILQRINLGLFALLGDLQGDRQLAGHRRGDLAVHPGRAVHPDGRGRGGVAGQPGRPRPGGPRRSATSARRSRRRTVAGALGEIGGRRAAVEPAARVPAGTQATDKDAHGRAQLYRPERGRLLRRPPGLAAHPVDLSRPGPPRRRPALGAVARGPAAGPRLPGGRGVGDRRARAGRHGLGPARGVRGVARGRPGRARGADLRPPRRPAGRAAGAVGQPAVRAGRARRPAAGPRCLRRQGPGPVPPARHRGQPGRVRARTPRR